MASPSLPTYCPVARDSFIHLDMHAHIIPPDWPDWSKKFGVEGFVRFDHPPPGGESRNAKMYIGTKFFREVLPNSWDPEDRLRDMDATHIDMQVLSTVPVLFNYWATPEHALETSRFINDHMSSVCHEYPNRFVGLGTLPMQDPDLAIAELRRIMSEEVGLRGVQIGTTINAWRLDDPHLESFWNVCEELGAAVLVHPWDGLMQNFLLERHWLKWLVGMPSETALAASAMVLGGVFQRHPKLRVCFAHGGGSFAFILGRLDHGYHCRPDLVAIDCDRPPSDFIGSFWVDSAVHDADSLRFLADKVTVDRVCLGSDYPFPLGEIANPGAAIKGAKFSSDDEAKMFYLNALEWLGVQPDELELSHLHLSHDNSSV